MRLFNIAKYLVIIYIIGNNCYSMNYLADSAQDMFAQDMIEKCVTDLYQLYDRLCLLIFNRNIVTLDSNENNINYKQIIKDFFQNTYNDKPLRKYIKSFIDESNNHNKNNYENDLQKCFKYAYGNKELMTNLLFNEKTLQFEHKKLYDIAHELRQGFEKQNKSKVIFNLLIPNKTQNNNTIIGDYNKENTFDSNNSKLNKNNDKTNNNVINDNINNHFEEYNNKNKINDNTTPEDNGHKLKKFLDNDIAVNKNKIYNNKDFNKSEKYKNIINDNTTPEDNRHKLKKFLDNDIAVNKNKIYNSKDFNKSEKYENIINDNTSHNNNEHKLKKYFDEIDAENKQLQEIKGKSNIHNNTQLQENIGLIIEMTKGNNKIQTKNKEDKLRIFLEKILNDKNDILASYKKYQEYINKTEYTFLRNKLYYDILSNTVQLQ